MISSGKLINIKSVYSFGLKLIKNYNYSHLSFIKKLLFCNNIQDIINNLELLLKLK